MADYSGTSGPDVQSGTNHADTFDYSQGGSDNLKGRRGDDSFVLGSALDSHDRIDGGDGYDTVHVSTATSLSVTFRGTTLSHVEALQFGAGNYTIVMNNANVAAGQHLDVLGADATSLVFNGAAEADGMFTMDGSGGNDTLTGGQMADVITAGSASLFGGNDILDGQGGDDVFSFFDDFTKTDKVIGGTGHDTIWLDGNYFSTVTFLSTTMVGVEEIDLDRDGGQFGYNLKFHDSNLASGETLTVEANTAANATLDGSAETSGKFVFHGSANFDDLFGGGGADVIRGGGEADLLKGNGGSDVFVYDGAADSTGPNYDTVLDFDANTDKFLTPNHITAVEIAVTHGTLTDANFDADLVGRITAGRMGANHAVLYSPDGGDHVGDTFLIVDLNHSGGYQAEADLVIDVTGILNATGLGTEDFIQVI